MMLLMYLFVDHTNVIVFIIDSISESGTVRLFLKLLTWLVAVLDNEEEGQY
jgi:hypothetical protein